jgi:hypothetical protein
VAAVLTVVAVATAAVIKPGTSISGQSTHQRYGLYFYGECLTNGCKQSTSVSINVTSGNPKKPHARCPYATFSVPGGTLKHGSFSASGVFSTDGLTFKVTGTFASATSVRGTVSGNHGCGTDAFRLTAPAAG